MEFRNMKICDTTLRDGEQAAGVVFSPIEKRTIARLLSASGVEQAEIGIPAMGVEEQRTIRSIVEMNLPMKLMTWNRATSGDIDASLNTGVDTVHLSMPVSDLQMRSKLRLNREEVKAWLLSAVEYSQRHRLQVSIGFEDASRAEPAYLLELIEALHKEGVRRFRYADTVSALHPALAAEVIGMLVQAAPGDVELEIHCHNDFGLATANTLAALSAGARWASTTVAGLGERAGNAPMEEVAMAWRHLYRGDCAVDPAFFHPLAATVSEAASRRLPEAKPIVGSMVFAHESGIHVDGMLKNRETYQSFDPREVGQEHVFVVGKHSGWNTLAYVLRQEGIELEREQAVKLLERVRSMAEANKRSLGVYELKQLIQRTS